MTKKNHKYCLSHDCHMTITLLTVSANDDKCSDSAIRNVYSANIYESRIIMYGITSNVNTWLLQLRI